MYCAFFCPFLRGVATDVPQQVRNAFEADIFDNAVPEGAMDVDHEYIAQGIADNVPEDDDNDEDYYTEDEDDRGDFPEVISHEGGEYGRSLAQRAFKIMTSTNRCVFFLLIIPPLTFIC